MIERGEELRFAFEARHALMILRELLRKNLDGDFAAEFLIARAIDFAHAACAERRDNFIRTQFGSGSKTHSRGDYMGYTREETRSEL